MLVAFRVTGEDLEVILMGHFTAREAEEVIASGLRSSRAERVRLLVDAEAEALAPPHASVEACARMLATLRPRLADRCAIVVPDDSYAGVLCEVGNRLAPLGLELAAFRDRGAAKAWLRQSQTGH